MEETEKKSTEEVPTTERKLHTRVCPNCKQQYQTKIGIDNWKNLFKKPTAEDWISLIILILVMAAAFAYSVDTQSCKETLNNLDKICMQYQASALENGTSLLIPNISRWKKDQ
jgi:hypothetical protein